jgi:hypothetical protein
MSQESLLILKAPIVWQFPTQFMFPPVLISPVPMPNEWFNSELFLFSTFILLFLLLESWRP